MATKLGCEIGQRHFPLYRGLDVPIRIYRPGCEDRGPIRTRRVIVVLPVLQEEDLRLSASKIWGTVHVENNAVLE